MDYHTAEFSFDALESKLLLDTHCGTEIDYDPDFLELENMVTVKAEQQYGATIIPASPTDWSKALTKATELLGKSKDYRLCSIITRALTHKYGITGALKGIDIIYALTENFWEGAFPSIMLDGETDLLPRSNAIAELNAATGLLGDLRSADINLQMAGKLSIARIEKILSGREEDESFNRDQLLQILRDETLRQNNELITLKKLINSIAALEKSLITRFGPEQAPNFSQLKNLLQTINPIVATATEDVIDEQESSGESRSDDIQPQTKEAVLLSVKSRADAIRVLDKVCDFLETNDPSNPAPLLIKRARNMIGQDFFTILSQIAPDGIAQAEHITGTKY